MDRIQAMNVFCLVVDCQGFAAAARELDLSPSVVTRLINELVAPNVAESIDDSFDLCIVVSTSEQLDGQFVARRLTCSHIIACASPGFLDRHGRPDHPGDYTALSLMHPAYVHELTFKPEREVLRATPHGAVTVVPAPAVMLSSHIDTLYAAALAGLGASGFPSYVVDEALKQGRLARVLPGWSLSVLHLFATYPSRRYMPMRTRVFLDFLVETFGGQEQAPWLGL